MGTIMPHTTTLPKPIYGNGGCTCSQTNGERCTVHSNGPWSLSAPDTDVLLGLAVDLATLQEFDDDEDDFCPVCLCWTCRCGQAALADEIRRIQREEDDQGYERDETDTSLAPVGPVMEDRPPRHDRAPETPPPGRGHPHVTSTTDLTVRGWAA